MRQCPFFQSLLCPPSPTPLPVILHHGATIFAIILKPIILDAITSAKTVSYYPQRIHDTRRDASARRTHNFRTHCGLSVQSAMVNVFHQGRAVFRTPCNGAIQIESATQTSFGPRRIFRMSRKMSNQIGVRDNRPAPSRFHRSICAAVRLELHARRAHRSRAPIKAALPICTSADAGLPAPRSFRDSGCGHAATPVFSRPDALPSSKPLIADMLSCCAISATQRRI